jgi:hypothetical protein
MRLQVSLLLFMLSERLLLGSSIEVAPTIGDLPPELAFETRRASREFCATTAKILAVRAAAPGSGTASPTYHMV